MGFEGETGTQLVSTQAAPVQSSSYPEINRDPAIYEYAMRVARINASRGENYQKYPGGGHPLSGELSGGYKEGSGWTRDPNRAGHCWEYELPESRIVARARAQGINGHWHWCAIYR